MAMSLQRHVRSFSRFMVEAKHAAAAAPARVRSAAPSRISQRPRSVLSNRFISSNRSSLVQCRKAVARPTLTRAVPNVKSILRSVHRPIQTTQTRKFHLHEYQSTDLFKREGIDSGVGTVCSSPDEVYDFVKSCGGDKDFVVKAQVLAGGRGKGRFLNGFQGGVHVVTTPEQAREVAKNMIGSSLVTKQTGPEGKPCSKVFVAERLFLRRETYFAILNDRELLGPVMVASPSGGMDIEAVARDTPELIFKEPIDILSGYSEAQLERLARAVGFQSNTAVKSAMRNYARLYDLFMKYDCTLVEVNPFAETHDGRVLCLDAKLNFDGYAAYRNKDLAASCDISQVDPREVKASEIGFNFVALDGNIGCMVNGAGLAMATMDVIKMYGGEPANFLDLGGGASGDQVAAAFNLLNDDPAVDAILVNIFGGIARCDHIALGIINAVTKVGLKKPVVVRLEGTNVKEAKRLIEDSGLRLLAADDLDDAAQKAVRISEIVQLASDANMKVSFELPL